MNTPTVIKRGDVVTLTFDAGLDLSGATSVSVIIAKPGSTPVVNRVGTVAGQIVTIDLTALETGVPGNYSCELEVLPGPHTHPSSGYVLLNIQSDLTSLAPAGA